MDRATGILGKLKRLVGIAKPKEEPAKEEKKLGFSG